MLKKKGQVAETTTWVFATLIIVIILLVSIYITSIIGTISGSKSIDRDSNYDLFVEKSLSSYLITENDSGAKIYEQLRVEDNLNDFNGNLSAQIFSLFLKDYKNVFLGILDYDGGRNLLYAKGNSYFGADTLISTRTALFNKGVVFRLIKLEGDKYLKVLLVP